MPVIRRAFIAAAPTLEQAVAAYDVVERMTLPLMARFATVMIQTTDETAPDARPGLHAGNFAEVDVGAEMPELLRSEGSLERRLQLREPFGLELPRALARHAD